MKKMILAVLAAACGWLLGGCDSPTSSVAQPQIVGGWISTVHYSDTTRAVHLFLNSDKTINDTNYYYYSVAAWASRSYNSSNVVLGTYETNDVLKTIDLYSVGSVNVAYFKYSFTGIQPNDILKLISITSYSSVDTMIFVRL